MFAALIQQERLFTGLWMARLTLLGEHLARRSPAGM
jgi:hypothetical protein